MLILIAAELQIRQNEVGIYNILMYKAERNRLKTQKRNYRSNSFSVLRFRMGLNQRPHD